MHRVCLLPGDGIGPEVVGQARRVLDALQVPLEFTRGEIGYAAYQKLGTPLPEETLEAVRQADATLFGAVTTPPNIPGYFSAIIRLRQTFELFANIRPCRSIPHPSSRPHINLVIVRENTEDLYSGVERVEDNGNRAISEMIITRKASERILHKAFSLARDLHFQKVTVVHKANVLRATCGLFLSVARQVAAQYPDLVMQDMLVDTCAMELIRDPQQFQVIVTTNLFGDILSDEASMLVGGLGVACSGNIGDHAAIFEPVHGSAPNIAGQHKANPLATFLSTAMLLDFLQEPEPARRLERAVNETIRLGQVTQDLDGSLTTEEATEAVIGLLNLKP
jgi:homoisocitrate dehydrogenase